MHEKKNILTYEGLRKYEDELHDLKVVKRKEVAQKIKEAREQGDLSENAEYDLARDEQAKMEQEIADLENKLHNAEIIDDNNVRTDTVGVGNKVTFTDLKSKNEMVYTIVGSQDSDPFSGKISNESPIGKALMGAAKGDTVTAQTKNGSKTYKIVNIE